MKKENLRNKCGWLWGDNGCSMCWRSETVRYPLHNSAPSLLWKNSF